MTRSGQFITVKMQFIFEILLCGFFYLTGYMLTPIFSFGFLKPESINWKIGKQWHFGTITHIV